MFLLLRISLDDESEITRDDYDGNQLIKLKTRIDHPIAKNHT